LFEKRTTFDGTPSRKEAIIQPQTPDAEGCGKDDSVECWNNEIIGKAEPVHSNLPT
jgi:hypothetical protein